MLTDHLSPNQNTTTTNIPPKPPDSPSPPLATFKSKLLASELVTDMQMEECADINETSSPKAAFNEEEEVAANGIKTIFLSKEETEGLYSPWKHSLIIKLLGKKTTHQYLHEKLVTLWKVSENFPLIDHDLDVYIAKFAPPESVSHVLQNGPWFINGHYLSIKNWEPSFVPENEKVTYSAVWVRLPICQRKFYDVTLLKRIDNTIGKLLKVDACTSSTLRGRYVRLCVQIPMDEPVLSSIQIGKHKQSILHEGEGFLCTNCDRFAHLLVNCPHHEVPSHTNSSHQDTSKSPYRSHQMARVNNGTR
ncbi:hypothetical protein P3L10_033191 [Capsicum annuum]|uniref:uncharacterized protein LOC107851987 n=1 Tax=Capsicum annuum TaxID=4072 RepID=UPI001FB054DA|nr:uncharacterized protein LOC107851987 [Capsicum annuum]